MSFDFRDFLRSHPAIISTTEALAKAGIEGAEDVALAIVGARLGFFSHLLPLKTILDGIAGRAESAIDGALDSLIAPPRDELHVVLPEAAPAPTSSQTPAPAQPDPTMRAKQAVRLQELQAEAEKARTAAEAADRQVRELQGL